MNLQSWRYHTPAAARWRQNDVRTTAALIASTRRISSFSLYCITSSRFACRSRSAGGSGKVGWFEDLDRMFHKQNGRTWTALFRSLFAFSGTTVFVSVLEFRRSAEAYSSKFSRVSRQTRTTPPAISFTCITDQSNERQRSGWRRCWV